MKINKIFRLIISSILMLNISSCKEETNDNNSNDVSDVEVVEEQHEEHEHEDEEESFDSETIVKYPTCTEIGEKIVRKGEVERTITLAPLGHNYSKGEVIKQPTETEKGIKVYRCTNAGCNEVIEEEFELKDSFKTYTETIVKAATCTQDGLKEYKKLNSGVEETIQEVIPALGHNFIEDDSIKNAIVSNPSNIDPGECKYSCSRCKELSDKTFKLSAKDFFYTEGLKKLCDYDMKVYPYLQKMWREIENGLAEAVKKAIAEKDDNMYIFVEIIRNYNEIPNIPKYDEVEQKIAHMVRHVNPQYWYLTCSTRSEIGGMNYWTMIFSEKLTETKKKIRVRFQKTGFVLLNSKDTTVKNVDSVLNGLIKPGMNDLEKLCAICKHIYERYSYLIYDGNDGGFPVFYENRQGVCANYAAMLTYMAQKAGLCCVTKTTSSKESNELDNHAWNWVFIEGNFYIVDSTNMGNYSSRIFSSNFLFSVDELGLSSSFFNNFVEPKYINKSIRSNIIQLYKNGQTRGMYASLDKALEKVNDPAASYRINCNLGFDSSNKNWYTYQTEVNCKSLTFYTSSDYKAEVKAPKEFFENKNVILESSITKKEIALNNY